MSKFLVQDLSEALRLMGGGPATQDAPAAPSRGASNVDKFTADNLPLAQRVGEQMGVDPSLLLGQWGLETGWGKSVIPGTNNLGNIKDFSGKGAMATDNMTGSRDAYRTYASADDFGNDFSSLITRRYKGAMNTGSDAAGYFTALKNGGYAEDPNYVQSGSRAAQMAKASMGRSAPVATETFKTPKFGAYIPGAGESATTMDFAKNLAGSFVQATGGVAQFVGEGMAGVANEYTGTEDYVGKNPLGSVTQAIQDSMTPGGKRAMEESAIEGDVTDLLAGNWDRIQLPTSWQGLGMVATGGAGSVFASMIPYAGQAYRLRQLQKAIGAAKLAKNPIEAARLTEQATGMARSALVRGTVFGSAMTGGFAAEEARENVQAEVADMSHDELLQKVPVYAESFKEFGNEEQARSAVVNTAARYAAAVAAPFGAVGGYVGGRVVTDTLLQRGLANMAGRTAASTAGRVAVTTPVGAVVEGAQETTEKVGGNMGENLAMGRSALDDVTRNTAADAIGGALMGGPIGAVTGLSAPRSPRAKLADDLKAQVDQGNSPLSRATVAANPDLAVDEFTQQANTIEAAVRDGKLLEQLRGIGQSGTVNEFLDALTQAKNPQTPPAVRQQAIDSLNTAMGWIAEGRMPNDPATGAPYSTDLSAPNAVPGTELTGAGEPSFFDPNVVDVDATRVDNMLDGPRALTGPPGMPLATQANNPPATSNTAGFFTPADSQETTNANEAPQTTEAQQASPQGPQATATAAPGAAAAVTQAPAAARQQVTAPKAIALPESADNPGTAQIRQRKAQLAAMAATGFTEVERRPEGFFLVNPAKQEEMRLDSPGDAQIARATVARSTPVSGAALDATWTAFHPESGTLNIPRAEMPQIKSEHRGAMVNFLAARGITGEQLTLPATDLKPTQAEFSQDKVNQAKSFKGGDRAILTSSDGHVLDGHHQWLAKLQEQQPIKVMRLNAPITELLQAMQAFPSAGMTKATLSPTTGASNDDGQGTVGTPANASSATSGVAGQGNTGGQSRGGVLRGDELRDAPVQSLGQSGRALLDPVADASAALALSKKEGRPISLADPASPATQAVDALLDVMAGLTGKRGIAVTDASRKAFDGAAWNNNFFINTDKPQAHVAQTIVHEFKHLSESFPGLRALYDRMWDLIPAEARRDYFETYLGSERKSPAGVVTRPQKYYSAITDADMQILKDEMLADFMGQRFNDRPWLTQLAKQRPALFGNFVREWLVLLNNMIDSLKGLINQGGSRGIKGKDVDALMKGYVAELEAMKATATDVAIAWAEQYPSLAKGTGVDAQIKAVQNPATNPALSARESSEFEGDTPTGPVQQFGLMAEEGQGTLQWKTAPGTGGSQLTATVGGNRPERLEMNEHDKGWDLGILGTWVGPTMGEADGYASKKAVQAFAQRIVAARTLHKNGTDLIDLATPAEREQVVNGWKDLSTLDDGSLRPDAFKYKPTADGRKSLKALAVEMGIGKAYDVSVNRSIFDESSTSFLTEFTNLKSGEVFTASLIEHRDTDGSTFFVADTQDLGKSGLGGAFYQMAATYAAERGMQLLPDSSLSGINAYRRTEQQLSAALRTGVTNVMVPHDVQRIYGFEFNPTDDAGHDNNLARLVFATVRNARELVSNFDDLTYHPETDVFTNSKGVDQGAKINKLLATPDLRAFGMGRSTLARAVLSRMMMQGELPAVESFAAPVLYSARATAEREYLDVLAEHEGQPSWLRAPNGEPTNLTVRQWVQVRTPSFRQWFGDWESFAARAGGVWNDAEGVVSKAVDKNGEPAVVYHGTDKGGFFKFQEPGGTQRGDLGIFTTDNEGMAASYIRKGHASRINNPDTPQNKADLEALDYSFEVVDEGAVALYLPNGEFEGSFDTEAEAVQYALDNQADSMATQSGIYAAFVNMRNPQESNFEGATWSGERQDQYQVIVDDEAQYKPDGTGYFSEVDAKEFAREFPNPLYLDDDGSDYVQPAEDHYETTDQVVREARRSGQDGAIIRAVIDDGGGRGYDDMPSDVFVALSSEQLKSADFNSGEFGAGNDIRYSEKVTANRDGTITVMGDVAAIRAQIPAAILGRVVEGGMRFARLDAPRVRAALDGTRNAYSRAGEVVAKNAIKSGKYIGAPEKFNTPQKLPSFRKLLMDLTKEGERGRFWYENSSEEILRMVGGDVREARKFVALLAIYSPQAKVDTNTTFALRAWAQHKAGHSIDVKTGSMDGKAQRAMDDVDEFWSGEKTGNFFNNLLREIDPTTEGAQGATIDMWMMRAAQYKNDAPTKSQYAFMELETNRIVQELGWEPQQVQAAIWVAMKARMENKGVKDQTEATSVKRGWMRYDYPVKGGRPEQIRVILDAQKHRDNWLKYAMAHDVTESDTTAAKFDFADGVLRHIGQISWEPRPSTSLPILPGIHTASYARQLEFQQAIQKALYSEEGGDLIAMRLGLLVDGSTPAPGIWQGDVSAGAQVRVAMAPALGGKMLFDRTQQRYLDVAEAAAIDADWKKNTRFEFKPKLDPAQIKLMDAYAAILGLLLRQDSVGYHRPFYAGKKSQENGVELNIGRPFTQQEAKSLWSAVNQRMADQGVVRWADATGLISSPGGMRVVNLGAIRDNKVFRTLVQNASENFATSAENLTTKDFTSDGNLVSNNWLESGNGESYTSRISGTGRPDLLGWTRDFLAPRVQAVFDDFSAKYDWGDPGRIQFSGRGDRGGRVQSGGVANSQSAAQQPREAGPSVGPDQSNPQALSAPSTSPLPGVPNVPGYHGPDPRLVSVAERYAQSQGITLQRQAEYVPINEARAIRLAAAYAAMPHAPNDPAVKAAYQELISQTKAQYDALVEAGYQFWFTDMSREDNRQYASSPWNAMRDLRNNQAMGIYPTEEGFGSGDALSDNPLEATSMGFTWPTGDMNGPQKPVLANDLFRAVHDAFGHGLEGAGFRAEGEENAWQAHSRLFTGAALGAITSETRGQNSWVNYGPSGEANRTAGALDTEFAPQKTGLMPAWTWTEGLAGDVSYSEKTNRENTSDQPTPGRRGYLGATEPDRQRGAALTVAAGADQPAAGRAPDRAVRVQGAIHYGKQAGLSVLSGSSSGTGIRGAEQLRLKESNDPRIKQRVYFYLPVEGGIAQPEIGLGASVYRADLTGLYDPQSPDRAVRGSGNDFESSVLDAGYKGYINRDQGTLVVLGENVPVAFIGKTSEHTLVPRRIDRTAPASTTREEGSELVRKPNAAEMMQLVNPVRSAKIREAAPSFHIEYGSFRVNAAEARVADLAISEFSPTFRFGEARLSEREPLASPDRRSVLLELLACL